MPEAQPYGMSDEEMEAAGISLGDPNRPMTSEAQPGQEQRMEREEFAACPLCKQYSHSIGDDQLATAFTHFKSMYSHRGDGIPTQHCFDEQTRDAAQVLMAAATRPTADLGEDGELVAALRDWPAVEPGNDALSAAFVAKRMKQAAERIESLLATVNELKNKA